MQISELARRTGVSPHALRHYDRLGLVTPVRRPSGYRDYAEPAIRDVRFIIAGRRMGFSLAFLRDSLPAWRSGRLTVEQGIESLRQRIAEIDHVIATQQALRKQLLGYLAGLERKQRTQSPPRATAWPMHSSRQVRR